MFKSILVLFIVCTACATASAQTLFKPLPKIPPPGVAAQAMAPASARFKPVVTPTDSTFWAPRPIVTTAYSWPNNVAMGGVGLSYQNITYNYAAQRFYCNYSISALGFGGGSTVPNSPASFVSYGVMLGALNNAVMAGVCFNENKDTKVTKAQFVFSIGINFNN